MNTLLFVGLVILFLASILLKKALASVDAKEFKRRARGTGDSIAHNLHKAAAYGQSAQLLLWLMATASLAALAVIAANSSWWLASIVIIVATWLLWPARPLKNYGGLWWKLASTFSMPLGWLLAQLQPVLGRFTNQKSNRPHTRAYEKQDLLELLKNQHHQADNRISDKDLLIALNALQFSDKKVSHVMQPRKTVPWVGRDEPIGPALLDELHASGFSLFPVVKEASKKTTNPEVVGVVFLNDLVDHTAGGKVRDVTNGGVDFINEDDDLHQALAAFGAIHRNLLIVVNNFEEIVGVLTLEQTIGQILGEKP